MNSKKIKAALGECFWPPGQKYCRNSGESVENDKVAPDDFIKGDFNG